MHSKLLYASCLLFYLSFLTTQVVITQHLNSLQSHKKEIQMKHFLIDKCHNPFAIRYNKANSWRGQVGQYKGFCVFFNTLYSVRALNILYKTYLRRGDNTPRRFFAKYAPYGDRDNNPLTYANVVASRMGITIDTPFEDNLCTFAKLASAIAFVETNSTQYSISTILDYARLV